MSYFLKEAYQQNLSEVSNIKTSDGSLTAIDKLLMSQTKIDEGIVSLSEMNVELTIKRLERMIDIQTSEEEINYYLKNFVPSKLQMQLVYSYLTRYFNSYRDENLISRRDYIRVLLLFKKRLLMGLGFQNVESGEVKYAALPYILTGNLSEKVNTRLIRNIKFNSKIENNYMYQYLVNEKYKYLEAIKPGYIKSLISSFVNTRYTYCVYESQDIYGEEIIQPEDKIADELLFFLYSI